MCVWGRLQSRLVGLRESRGLRWFGGWVGEIDGSVELDNSVLLGTI